EQSVTPFGMLASKSNHLHAENAEKMIAHVKTLLSEETSIQLESTEGLTYVSLNGKDQQLYFESQGLTDDIRGYAGPVHIGVFVNEDGTIASVHHIASLETESYLRKISQSGY